MFSPNFLPLQNIPLHQFQTSRTFMLPLMSTSPPPPQPLHGDQLVDGETTPMADVHRFIPTPFLIKTYRLVDDPSVDDIISWNSDGSTFIVWRPAEFARDLLPMYFKHSNFSSFVRQLNTYGFRKIVPDRWEFSNDCFRRGEKHLLCEIHRRKIAAAAAPPPIITVAVPTTMVLSPVTSGDEQVQARSSSMSPKSAAAAAPSTTEDLVDENERLRRENIHLNQELTQMKGLCNNIYTLMSNYDAAPQKESGRGGSSSTSGTEKQQQPPLMLQLMEVVQRVQPCSNGKSRESREKGKAEEVEMGENAMLFGVRIGMKRQRTTNQNGGVGVAEEAEQWRHRGVKVEPMDESSSPRDGQWDFYGYQSNQNRQR